jgi:hypothetical protein
LVSGFSAEDILSCFRPRVKKLFAPDSSFESKAYTVKRGIYKGGERVPTETVSTLKRKIRLSEIKTKHAKYGIIIG